MLFLLERVATTTEEHNGKVKVAVGAETLTFYPPRGKDIDTQIVVDHRRLWSEAGRTP